MNFGSFMVPSLAPVGTIKEDSILPQNGHACLKNAEELISAAITLLKVPYAPQAEALACTAIDEVGKAVKQIEGKRKKGRNVCRLL